MIQGSGQAAELKELYDRDGLARSIGSLWDEWNTARRPWLDRVQETRNFIFATDTSKTTNSSLPWKNTTVLPKLTQIRDNLHANYLAAVLPNDDWLRWEAHTIDQADQDKRVAIQSYMSNKVRESNMRTTISQLLYDYIDTGNCFWDVDWVNETSIDDETGELLQGYVGPNLVRIAAQDIVFNPTANSFKNTPKITRSVMTIGDLKSVMEDHPDREYLESAIKQAEDIRSECHTHKAEDFDKSMNFEVDGFGSLSQYFNSGTVEILELEGNIHDPDTGKYLKDHVVTIIDRSFVIRKQANPAWTRGGFKEHVGWRFRPDNLYAMGPMDNLVGIQYRIDHLENAKADAVDQYIHPPKVIKGDVDEFNWGPDEEIHVDVDGAVELLRPDLSAIVNTQQEIMGLMNLMEEFAGAPKQAMGIRTPGEKTAFEVQSLENAAGRIFQEKITNFEINGLEPALNSMLEVAVHSMDTFDVIRVMDDDLGVEQFMSITKDDITAKGKLRPVGARHFAAKANRIQTLTSLSNTPIWQQIQPHVSSKTLANMVEDILDFNKYDLIQDNIAIMEQAETQRLVNQVQQDVAAEAETPVEAEMPSEEEMAMMQQQEGMV